MAAEKIIDPITKSTKQIVPLTYPIPVMKDDRQIGQVHQIELGRVKVKHLKSLPASFLNVADMSPADMRQVLIAVIPYGIEMVDEIDLVDVKEIVKVLKELLK